MKNLLGISSFLVVMTILSGTVQGTHEDRSHFSKAYGTMRPYRIYLPAGYSESGEPYPVIYIAHGWGGAHDEIDDPSRWPGVSPSGIQELCDQDKVITVFWNGQMGGLHPYNIGHPSLEFINHASPSPIKAHVAYQTQFKDYVPELIEEIDRTFNTRKDRAGRMLFGHSMGGFMSGFISGKYPQLFNGAFFSAPSPRWFMGYPGRAVYYSIGAGFINHKGLHLRLHNTTEGQLWVMNLETRDYARRIADLDFTYAAYEGGHRASISLPALKDAYAWAMECLKNPLPDPKRWDHADLYDSFDVWGYHVESNLNTEDSDQLGYIELHGVAKGGFGIRTRQWLPDGVPVEGVVANVVTDAVYQPCNDYTLLDYNVTGKTSTRKSVSSDAEGRIRFDTNHEEHNFGIFRDGDPAEIVAIGYLVNGNSRFLPQASLAELKIQLLNRGGANAEQLHARVFTNDSRIKLLNQEVDMGTVPSGEAAWSPVGFKILANVETPSAREPLNIRLNLEFSDASGNCWVDELDVPVYYNVSPFNKVLVDDGVGYENAMRALPDSLPRGTGNGNGIAEPGETVMLYTHAPDGNWRTRVFFEENPFIKERFFGDINRLPGTWGDGHMHTSLLEISNDTPDGFTLEMLAMYESNDVTNGAMPFVKVPIWGSISLKVSKSSP